MQQELKNIFVTKEVAKLAKEKGFNEVCAAHYKEYGYNDSENCMPNTYQDFFELDSCDDTENFIEAPTHFQLMQWLFKEHDTLIYYSVGASAWCIQPSFSFTRKVLININDALIFALNQINQ